MALPAGWTLVPVSGTFSDNSGNPCTGSIVFTSRQVVVIDGVVVVPATITAQLDGTGHFQVDLPSTNDPGLNVTGWAYQVYERIAPAGRGGYAIFVPYDSAAIDLATAAPVVPPPELVSTIGPKGDPGDAATIEVGSVQTLAPGAPATVDNAGSPHAAVLNFGIPTGAQGPQGAQGIAGPAGPAGLNWTGMYDGAKTYAEDDAVSYLNASWFATAAHAANDGIPPTDSEGGGANAGWALLAQEGAQGPQGPQGVQGIKGDAGTSATITPGTTTTLSPGSSATVTNSGTSSAAVFDFGIPQGAKGDPGTTDYNALANKPTLGTAAAADFAAMPFINLMPDSGMFGGIVDPLSGALLPSAFQNTGPFIVTYNGSTITNDGSKFIHNNSTNGGTAGALTSTVVALLSAMGRTGNNARYGNEFFVAQLNAGTGTGGSISTLDGTLYLMTGGSAAFASAENYETFVGWVRVRTGSNTFYVQKIGKLYIDHVEVTGAAYKFADNTFHHVRAIVQMAAGYASGFPYFFSTAGTVIDIALPGFFTGLVDVGLHTSPLKTINAVSGGQPAPMPLAGGAFGGPAAPASYTLTTLPSAATYSGYLIRVSNATGGPALCMSDGTNWINIRTGSAVS